MAQSTESLRKKPPRHTATAPTATALKKITEAVAQINALTRRAIAKDALWDITRSTLETLQDKFDSGIWLLRAIWYAEPVQLVTIGKWMSRIDRETTSELNALNAHIRARDEYETTDDEYEDIYRYGNDTTLPRYYTEYADTAPDNYNTFPLDDKYRSDATKDTSRTGDCWPPTGECQSCGFQPQQRAGNRCIVLARVCNSCGMTGHMEKTCRETLELEPIQATEHTDTTTSTSENNEAKPPDDQPTQANPRETNVSQNIITGEQTDSEKRHNTGPTESENHVPQHKQYDHTTTRNEIHPATLTRKDDTKSKTGNNANNTEQNPAPEPQPGANHDDVKTYLWGRLSEAVNALRSNSTHELSATELSLAERTGIGDDDTTTTPAREKHFRNTHYHQTVS